MQNILSENFISAAKRMQSGEELKFEVPIEGDIVEEVSAVHEPGVDAAVLEKVNFFQGDACALSKYADEKEGFGTFDGAIMANLLCRLPDPMACLDAMPKIINKGGVVVIVTPFTWLEGERNSVSKIFQVQTPTTTAHHRIVFLISQTLLPGASGSVVSTIPCRRNPCIQRTS